MAETAVITLNYDPDIAALAVAANCDKLVQSLDPVSIAPKLVSRGLISSQQAQNILDDRVKTRAERNLAFLNLIKSSSYPTWFSSLLEAIGEDKTTETLKEVLEKSYRAVELERRHGLSHASPITLNSMAVSSRKGKSSSSYLPAKRSKQSVTDVTATQEPPSLSSRKGKSSSSRPSAKRPRRSLQLQQKQLSSSEPPAKRSKQSVTDVTATQEPPSHSITIGLWTIEESRPLDSSPCSDYFYDLMIKSGHDSMWFSSLLQAFGEETMTEGLKEALEESCRALKSGGGHGLPHASQITSSSMPVSSQIRGPSTSQPGKHSQFHHVWHPLENEFERVKTTFLKVLEEKQRPSLNDLKEYCRDRVASVETMQLCVAKELEDAPSYEAVVRILFKKVCKWLSFSLLEMILDYFQEHLGEVRTQVEVYKKQLKKALQEPLVCTEEYLNQGESPPTAMQKIFVRCLLEAKGITPEDVIAYRQFLSSSLEIPVHLLVLISVLYGSLLLELWIPKELTPQVVQRVEEVWRELLRRKVECIEVGDRSFDLLQESNKEKATLIGALVSRVELWESVPLSCGTRLYEEYGRHESLQSCVRKHKEAGRPSPEELGALEWLLLQHTPEVAEREGKDPLNVLLTTVYLGCCDVKEFVRAVVRCLEGDPAVGRRLVEASMEFVHGSLLTSESFQTQGGINFNHVY